MQVASPFFGEVCKVNLDAVTARMERVERRVIHVESQDIARWIRSIHLLKWNITGVQQEGEFIILELEKQIG